MRFSAPSGSPIAAPLQPWRNSRLHVWLRALLAGPGAAGLTVLVMAGMPFWVPKGAGGVDHMAIDGGLLLIGFSFSPPHSFGNRLLKTLSNCLAIVCLVI
jgi:hypothetical protein